MHGEEEEEMGGGVIRWVLLYWNNLVEKEIDPPPPPIELSRCPTGIWDPHSDLRDIGGKQQAH